MRLRLLRLKRWKLIAGLAIVLLGISGLIALLTQIGGNDNPLAGSQLYRDNDRPIVNLVTEYQTTGRTNEATLLQSIASQPNTTWLIGPSETDPQANRDIALMTRTSTEALAQDTLPVYELYAIPRRDACAGYSAAGFQTDQQYLAWVDRLIDAQRTKAVFSVEADAIAHAVGDNCLSEAEKQKRYNLIKQAVEKLSKSPHGAIIYIDAGHPEWFPDPAKLVGPLKAAGVDSARGVAVNVSFFESSDVTASWAQKLTALLGKNKGAIIDTSRSGRGAPASTVTGEARWCNPTGRALGASPTTETKLPSIDAFLWIKNPGESDGNCFGNPPAGSLSPALALELARNASQ